MRKEIDWIKGHVYKVFTVNLPKGFSLILVAAEHESGKITISQVIAATIGFFDLETLRSEVNMRDLNFHKRFHSFVKFTREV